MGLICSDAVTFPLKICFSGLKWETNLSTFETKPSERQDSFISFSCYNITFSVVSTRSGRLPGLPSGRKEQSVYDLMEIGFEHCCEGCKPNLD